MEVTTEQTRENRIPRLAAYVFIPLSFLALEVFGWFFLRDRSVDFSLRQLWPLAFGLVWAVGLGAFLRIFPRKISRILYGILYFLSFIYAGAQTGYYFMFSEMMWLTDFTYASEGADYLSVLLTFPVSWWISLIGLGAVGVVLVAKYPRFEKNTLLRWLCGMLAVTSIVLAAMLPYAVFFNDRYIKFARSDYGRSQSAEAAYKTMFNAHRLYEVCGLQQMAVKDLYANMIYPHTPAYASSRKAGIRQVDEYFAQRPAHADNAMTGLFQGKNVVLVLMESMDDWLIGPHTPTISRLMEEGINFTQFYTPAYGGIRTFNTEFCTNNGFFLSSDGGHAFDFVNNDFSFSLPNTLRREGYSAKVFHYNDPEFYSRGVYSLAMGYDEYVCYRDYVEDEDQLYDDKILFDNGEINDLFFREGSPTLNFIITRSAHLSYQYNEPLSHWGLQRYPQYRGLTGHEEEDCAYLKARLVDDMYTRLLEELEAHGTLDNTVIIGITDHYTYGFKDLDVLYARSGVEDALLLEKTPMFIWAKDLTPMVVEKTANTSDMLPTMLNLFGITPEVDYIGGDIFDNSYPGFVPFSDGSWISGGTGYNAKEKTKLRVGRGIQVPDARIPEITDQVAKFVHINNQILDTDYYKTK